MQCDNCGEKMEGDGYTTILHCPNSTDVDIDFKTPDDNPVHCVDKPLNNVMIDLETMGVSPSSAIVSIGAVVFDPERGLVSDDTFYKELNWACQERTIDRDTVKWWSTQNENTRNALNGENHLDVTLRMLTSWLPDDCKVWGNGSLFDIGILENAYSELDIDIPWRFWNIRDCRTVRDIYDSRNEPLDLCAGENAHNALHDAKFQAGYICEMWRNL